MLLSGCAEIGLEPNGVPLPIPARPILREERELSPTFGASLIANRRVDGLALEIYSVGQGQVRGNFFSELKSPKAKLKPEIFSYLIRHPRKGLILFGTGLPPDVEGPSAVRVKGSALSPFIVEGGRNIASQLGVRGVDAASVGWIILPSLSPEWAGRTGAFPHAEVLISSRAWEEAMHSPAHIQWPNARAFVPEEKLRLIDMNKEKSYGPFEHGFDLFGDGTIIVIDLEGGTAGGVGVWVNLDSGPVLLAGTAAFVYDNIFDDALPDRTFVVDISSFAWNARAMKTAKQAVPRLIILPSHDTSSLTLSPRQDVLLVPKK